MSNTGVVITIVALVVTIIGCGLAIRWIDGLRGDRAEAVGKAATAEAREKVTEDRAARSVDAAVKDKELTDALAGKKLGTLDRLRARRARERLLDKDKDR